MDYLSYYPEVRPIISANFSIDLIRKNFDFYDISSRESSVSKMAELRKDVYLVPCQPGINYEILLRNLDLKLCSNAANYLLGLILSSNNSELSAFDNKLLIAIDHLNPIKISNGKKEAFITFDFRIESYKRLVLSYKQKNYGEEFILLAEK